MAPLVYSPPTDLTDAVIDAPYIPDTGDVVVAWMNRRRKPLSVRLFRGAILLAVLALVVSRILA